MRQMGKGARGRSLHLAAVRRRTASLPTFHLPATPGFWFGCGVKATVGAVQCRTVVWGLAAPPFFSASGSSIGS